MADRLTAMEVFVRAVRLGSLSAAARELDISPTMATKHFDALEARLGTTLALRTTRRISLTEAGTAYLDRAERILLEIGEAEADASSQSISIQGLLRVSAPTAFGIREIAPLAPAFQSLHPDVVVEFGFSDRMVDLLEERWDVGIRIGRLPDSLLIAKKIAPLRTALCGAPSYLRAHGTPATLADLIHHNCLGYTSVPQAGTSSWSFGSEGEFVTPIRGNIHADNGEALVRAAIAGHGLVYGPRYIAAEALAAGDLVAIELDVPSMHMGAIHTVTHPNRRPAAKTVRIR